MIQLHQHQVWQQQLLEQQLQKHKEMLTVEHEKQKQLLIAKHVSTIKVELIQTHKGGSLFTGFIKGSK